MKEDFERVQELTQYRLKERRQKRTKRLWTHIMLCSAVMVILLTIAIVVLGIVTGEGVFQSKNRFTKYIATPPAYSEQFLPINEYQRPGTLLEDVEGIVIHDSKNSNSHFMIGLSGEIVQYVPLEEISYASNDANMDTITIECCIDNEEGRFNEKIYESLVELTAWIVGKYDLTMDDVIRGFDENGETCPKYFVEHESAWEDFKLDVTKYIETYGTDK